MTAVVHASPLAYAPALPASLERLRGGLLWLTGFAGAFVFMEPSPYEVASMLAIFVFVVTGLSLRPALMPFIFLLFAYNIGFSIAVVPVLGAPKTLLWVLVSWYMATTAVFFAAMLGTNTEQRLSLLLKGYMIAALVASIAGIVGYFRLVPRISELFLLYDRARGTFNDPNVLGAFLVLPALLALQQTFAGRARDLLRGGALLMVFIIGLLLSFSRGAWGQFAFCATLMLSLTFITSRSRKERVRILGIAAVAVFVLALCIAALLSIGQVAELFKERASLDQSYDSGQTGRFGRHVLGLLLALDRPWGIGPLQFARFFPEDPHNSYLNAFMSGGWLSGACYVTLVVLTLVTGFRYAFVPTPWRTTYIAVYAAFAGIAGESFIIDTDHWRHYFLTLGVLWGLIAASRQYQRAGTRHRIGARPPPLAPVVPAA